MPRKNYCYAIVNNKNNKLLFEDGKLPIYYNRKVAKERAKLFKGFRLEIVNFDDLQKFILTAPY